MKKTTVKKIGLSTLLAASLLTSTYAGSVGGFGGSLEVTQWSRFGAETLDRANSYAKQLQEYALQAQQYQQQINQYVNQFQSYQQMLQNIGQLPQAQWDQFSQSVQGLKHSLDFGQSLSFTASSYNTDFNNLFPGFDKYVSNSQSGPLDFQATYKQLGDTTRDTVNGSLKVLKLRADDLQNDEAVMRQLQTLSTSAVGQKSAIQAANEIALHQTHQLKKLEETIMTQANMQGEYYAMENEKKAFQEAQAKAKTSDGIKPTLGDEHQVTPW